MAAAQVSSMSGETPGLKAQSLQIVMMVQESCQPGKPDEVSALLSRQRGGPPWRPPVGILPGELNPSRAFLESSRNSKVRATERETLLRGEDPFHEPGRLKDVLQMTDIVGERPFTRVVRVVTVAHTLVQTASRGVVLSHGDQSPATP